MVGRVMVAEAQEGKLDYLDVLVVAAAPVDLRPALNLGVELAKLEDIVRRSAIPIRMRRVFPPTYAQLEKELSAPELERRRREPRVLHFLGHGEMDGLWFEREDGSGERIPTNRIVRLLKGSPVKFALLNACWSATNLVASLCDRLTQEGGIPAAIGHRNQVDDASAIAFACEFYRQVVLGKSIVAAKNLAASSLLEQVELKGDGMLRLADDLAGGERPGRVEDGMPLKNWLPGAAFFAGRHDEFTAVAATLDDTEQVAYGIWGIGGIGKTRLTLELARRNAWRYPGGITWVEANNMAPSTAAGILQLAWAKLEPASTAPDAASGLLRHMKRAPVLLVLDNLEMLPPGEHQVLAGFLKSVERNGSRVLVTARSELRGFDDVPGTRSRTLTTGLDEYSGAHHAFHYARLKDVKALRDQHPRVAEGGRVEGKCALVSRRLSGHPRMIELAVGVARQGWEALEQSLESLSGDLEEQLRGLLETGLKLVGPEGQALMRLLRFFGSGKFMREEMEAVARAAGGLNPANERARVQDREESDADRNKSRVDRGLKQLEQAGLIELEQDRGLYTFHQSLLDHVVRELAMDTDRARSGLIALLGFYLQYVRDHRSNDVAIDRCFENLVSTLEIAWGLYEEGSPLDLAICSVVDGLGYYFEGRGLWRLGERWLERAIALRRSSTLARDQAALAFELFQRSQILYRCGERAESRSLLRESIATNQELGNRQGLAACQHALAVIEHDQGNPAEARRLLRESIAVAEELGDRLGIANSLSALAIIEHTQGDPTEARRLLRETVAICEELGNRRFRAASLHELAIIEQAQGNPAEARKLLRDSITEFGEVGDRHGLADCLHELAIIEHTQGSSAEARRLLRESITVKEEMGDRQGRAASLHQLALIEHSQGNPAEARRLLRESIAVNEELGIRMGRAASFHQLAVIEHTQGDTAEAHELLRESIAACEELDDRLGHAVCLHELARIEQAQGNAAMACRLLRESIAMCEELGDRRIRAACLHELAIIEQAQGNLAEARMLVRESIIVKEELGDRHGHAISLYVLAMIEQAQGNPDEARGLVRESIAVFEELGDRSSRAASLHQLAMIEQAQGNSAEARELLRASNAVNEELGDRHRRAACLHELAMIEQAQGNRAEARSLWEESIEINKEIRNIEGIASSMGMLAQLTAQEGRFEEAMNQGREAVRLMEQIGSFKAARARESLRLIEVIAAQGAGA
jgi:tetratricopeptide (TPR) repeat protein